MINSLHAMVKQPIALYIRELLRDDFWGNTYDDEETDAVTIKSPVSRSSMEGLMKLTRQTG